MKPHQCSICQKTFKRMRDAEMHNRDTHSGDGKVVPTGKRRYNLINKENENDDDDREDLEGSD